MAFKKVSAKEWGKMGLPSSTWTISFGVGVPKKRKLKKSTSDLHSKSLKKNNHKRDLFPLLNLTFLVVDGNDNSVLI